MSLTQDNNTLNRIKELCAAKKWSVYRLAKESDIPYSSLNNIFIRNTHPTVPTLEKICNGLGITMSEFFENDLSTDYSLRRNTLSQDEYDLLEIYDSLHTQDKAMLIAYAKGLAKKL